MPIREFKCKKGHVTEKLLFGYDDKNIKRIPCPKCWDEDTLLKPAEIPKVDGISIADRIDYSVPALIGVKLQGFTQGEMKQMQHDASKELRRLQRGR